MAFTRHKVFVSYYHYDDQRYRDAFEKAFGHLMISKSVHPGDIDDDNSTNYIKRLIQLDYISDSSVVLVLMGPNTRKRKHVDWEISAGLTAKVGGAAGLVGICLPEMPVTPDNKVLYDNMPGRFADNNQSGFSLFYYWNWITSDANRVAEAIQTAFDNRINQSHLIKNGRLQMQRNLS